MLGSADPVLPTREILQNKIGDEAKMLVTTTPIHLEQLEVTRLAQQHDELAAL